MDPMSFATMSFVILKISFASKCFILSLKTLIVRTISVFWLDGEVKLAWGYRSISIVSLDSEKVSL